MLQYKLGIILFPKRGELPEWPMGTDCKSVGESLRRFESYTHHHSFQLSANSFLASV